MPPARDRLLELIGDAIELVELAEFRVGVLHALHGTMPADWVALSDVGPDPDSVVEVVDPPLPAALSRTFAELAYQNPLVQRYERTRDGRAYRFSDVVTSKELHALEIYKRVYKPIGQEHQIAFTLDGGEDRILAIVLGRKRRRGDFTDRERDLLNDARPFLIQAYHNAIRFSEVLAGEHRSAATARPPAIERLVARGLTHRQAEVLRLLAAGASARDIADSLAISERTVQKHLEHCYRQLGVRSRSEASAIVWSSEADAVTGRRRARVARTGPHRARGV